MNAPLAGRTAVVTGASRGIGRALVDALVAHGVRRIGLIARDGAALAEVARLLSARGVLAETLTADLGDIPRLGDVSDELTRRLGAVDILINNAATVTPLGPTSAIAAEEYLAALGLNVVAPAVLSAQLAGPMAARGWGRIVNISSGIAAHRRT
jgi:short-subunit dehydrogenase